MKRIAVYYGRLKKDTLNINHLDFFPKEIAKNQNQYKMNFEF